MSRYLIVWDILKKELGDKAKDHIIATTSESKGNLIKLAKAEGFKTFYIPDGVGGRFSELCPVGLLPAAATGIDIKQMLAGAAFMDKLCKEKAYKKNPALMSALLSFIAMKKGKNISVMMPYADSLRYMSDWYCQLWAEEPRQGGRFRRRKGIRGADAVKASALPISIRRFSFTGRDRLTRSLPFSPWKTTATAWLSQTAARIFPT